MGRFYFILLLHVATGNWKFLTCSFGAPPPSLLYFLFLNIKFLGRGAGEADLKRICEYKMLYLGGGGGFSASINRSCAICPTFSDSLFSHFFLSAPLNQITVPLYIYFFYTFFPLWAMISPGTFSFFLVSIREIFGTGRRLSFLFCLTLAPTDWFLRRFRERKKIRPLLSSC